jgi:hypothetical protein
LKFKVIGSLKLMALRVKITAFNRYLSHFSKFLCNSNECAENVK